VTGFLGNHVCKLFLEDGSYRVRGSTTNPNNPNKREGIKAACGEELFKNELELVKADLTNSKSVDLAVQGCEYVVHVASPVPASMPFKHEEEKLIKTAVEGTLNVLRAAFKHKVKRVVVTSSTAAVIDRSNQVKGRIITENDWANENQSDNPYSKSKILSEKAAWQFWNSLPENERFELVCLNPGNFFGPSFKREEFASANIIRAIITWSRIFGFPKIYY
jgi:nucleoside-diphosphate-sugar epimerase